MLLYMKKKMLALQERMDSLIRCVEGKQEVGLGLGYLECGLGKGKLKTGAGLNEVDKVLSQRDVGCNNGPQIEVQDKGEAEMGPGRFNGPLPM